jgi:hypothetical protein
MSRIAVNIGWDDVPHLSAEAKADLLKSFPPYQRDARSKGIPQLGAGAIYPIPESDVFIPPIEIPPWWKRSYGLDVGWNRTAAVWGAHDLDSDILYITHEYERSMAEPSVHVGGINVRGKWMAGVIDPASRGRSQVDGAQLVQNYRDLGLDLSLAKNAVESGLFEVFQRMTTGRLKIFDTCIGVKREFRLYRRDEKGRVVKKDDHLMDAMRYEAVSGIAVGRLAPNANEQFSSRFGRGSPNVASSEWKPFD